MATKKDNLQVYVTDIAGTIRSVEGSTENINAQDFSDRIRAIGETSGIGGKTTPSFTSGRANKIIISHKNSDASFYPRWAATISDTYLFTNNSVIDVNVDDWSFGSPTVLINTEQEGVDDVGDLIAAPIEHADDLIVFYKANNLTEPTSYSIIAKIFRNGSFVPDLTQTIEGAGSLHQPFVFGNYVYYCEESEDGTRRDIKRAKITYRITEGMVKDFNLGIPEIVISGENNLDDDGTNELSAHLGSPTVAQLADGNLIIIYDSDVNRDLDYPYTIQYSYSTDDGETWEDGRTLFKTIGYSNKAPYVVVDPFGKVTISYHTNSEYIENSYGTDTIYDYVFKVFITNSTIYCGETLTPANFVEIPIRRDQADEWTGVYGSLAIINGEVAPIYGHGPYDNESTIIDTVETTGATVERIDNSPRLVVYAHEGATEKTIAAEIEVISNSIVRRNEHGVVYGSTATNLDPTKDPTVLTTKAYVANFGNANYLPLKGGTISGNLSIGGNLTVAGESTILEAAHLRVEDAVIETNSKGNDILTISGLAIHKNATDTYIIGYDPTNDSVKLGFGEQDANKNWVFKTGEGNPIATRADASLMTDNGFVVWNQNKKRLETTMITGLVGEGEAKSVRYNQDEGFTYGFGCLLETTYTNSDFDLVLSVPLVSGEGITFAPTNDGKRLEVKLDTAFIDGKYVEKVTAKNIAYTTDNDGKAITTHISFNPTAWDLVTFDGKGCLRTSNPTGDDGRQCVNKQYADANYVPIHNSGKYYTLYGTMRGSAGEYQQISLEFDQQASAGTIPQRGSDGTIQVGTPTTINDATTKAYVDNLNTITITAGA